MQHKLRFFVEAILAGLIVGLVIVWASHGHLPQLFSSGNVSYANAVSKAAPAVVNIYTTRTVYNGPDINQNPLLHRFLREPRRKRLMGSLGSGVIVSKKGYVLTSYHVIKDADAILIALTDGRETPATIVGTDPPTDLALLHINLKHLPVIEPNTDGPVKVGDVVLAIGNPFGIGQTVSMGIVGATGRSHLGIATFENFIQTDAAINKGNSGGALIDTSGNLIGINTAILSSDGRWQGIGFATPAPIAEEVMHDLIKYGRVIRGYLGVSVQDITPQLAATFNLPQDHGGLIAGIVRNSPADKAGLLPGDVLTGINGKPIQDGYQAMNIVAGTRPGSKITLDISRNGKNISLPVTVGTRPRGMDYEN